MNDLVKKLISIFLIIILLFIFSNSLKGIQNIDSFAYVVAIGLDKGINNNLKITFQTLSPAESSSISSSSSSSSGGGESSSSVITTSIECASINSGLQLINGYIGSKQLNLSHCQSLIFSEALAYDGISEYIYTFVNIVNLNHDANIVISKCDAEFYLNNSESVYEKLISKYYNVSPTSGKYTGFTTDISLQDFFSDLNSNYIQPTAILSSINLPQTTLDNSYDNTYLRDSTFKAGQSPINSENRGMEDVGLAIFKDGKLIGELTAIETIAYLMSNNQFSSCELTISDPIYEKSTIDFGLSKQKNSKTTVKFVNDTPYITTEIYLDAKILSIEQNTNYSSSQSLLEVESALNNYLETILYEYLYKTTIEYKSDISGFGKYAIPQFLSIEDWNNYNWNSNYKNSFFNVKVHTRVDSGGLLLET